MAKEVPDLRRDASEDLKGDVKGDVEDDARDDDDEWLRCAVCGFEIASKRDAIAMSGAHEHTFVNPAGVVFEVGCFRQAAGCVEVGDEDATFTWFPGWTWQIVICGRCRSHLGWKFRLAPEAFWGLIRTKLRG